MSVRPPSPKHLLGFLLPVFLMCGQALAQELPGGIHFGMSSGELRLALPGVEPVTRPQRFSGNLAGTWRLPVDEFAGLSGQRVFFFGAGRLQRVEFFHATREEPDGGNTSFDRLVAWGRSSYGPELVSQGYAAWSLPTMDVYAQRISTRQEGVRLVFRQRDAREGDTL